MDFGIPETIINVCATTGLTVDIHGLGPKSDPERNTTDELVSSLALRADMDGLPMPEENEGLEYTSQTEFAHMCGHDGHVATLLSTAKGLWSCRESIP